MSEEKDQARDDERKRALIEVVTENGFYIARLSDLEKSLEVTPYEYHFIVRASDETERNVAVRFSNEAVALIQRRRRVPLADASYCWINCAEHSLAAYLVEKNHLPPGGKLLLEELSLDEMEATRRWDDGHAKESLPSSYDEKGLTPVEGVIARELNV